MLNVERVNSALHYDRVTKAWQFLLGENLHYGYFCSGAESLSEATECMTEQLAGLIHGLKNGAKVLDVGCGTGRPASVLAEKFGCEVVGISPSVECIENAQKLVTGDLSSSLSFEIGDAQRMRFEDNTFDVAWVMESSHLILDKNKLFEEIFRVLKPGGQLVLCDISMQKELPLQSVIENRDEFLLLKDVFGRAIMKTPQFYKQEMETRGFRDVRCQDITAETVPTFQRWKDNAVANKKQVSEMLGQKAWSDFHRSTVILKRFWDKGVLGYFMLSARKAA
jgi:27-O-demethylrifamycin SV methyltransferase